VPITGTERQPVIGGDGIAIEYAVKMRQFPQSSLLDNALARGDVAPGMIETLAQTIAAFHARLPPQNPADAAEFPLLEPARENFEQMLPLLSAPADIATLSAVRDWTLHECTARAALLQTRAADGRIRECHGDLHLGNIALLKGVAVPFDCIEFNPALRWIDVINEVAFLMMDLDAHGHRDYAYLFINQYLEACGDYAGVVLLPLYSAYRAVVRAKVHLLRAAQPDLRAAQRLRAVAGYHRYMTVAAAYTHRRRAAIIITHGLAGAGKTTISGWVLAALGAIRLRSDVERKRLHGVAALAATGSEPGGGAYTDDATERTYDHLLRHAKAIAGAGFPVIVDAAFLKHKQRAAFRTLAAGLGIDFVIIDVRCGAAELRARISARHKCGADASEATLQVLDAQMLIREALTPDELNHTFNTTATASAARALCTRLERQLGKL
jgi:aminoglycoside phosphotransferase family enzyme/predicted kinase